MRQPLQGTNLFVPVGHGRGRHALLSGAVTGQNPASAGAVGEAIVELLRNPKGQQGSGNN